MNEKQKIFLMASNDVSHIIQMWKISDKLVARPRDTSDKTQDFKILNSHNKQIARFFRGDCEILKFSESITFEPEILGEPPELIQNLILNQKKSEKIFSKFRLAVNENDIRELRTISEIQEN